LEEIFEDRDDDKKGDLKIHYPELTSQRLENILTDLVPIDEARERCRDERNRASSVWKRGIVEWGEDCMNAVVDATKTLISAVGMKNLNAMVADPAGAMSFAVHPDDALYPSYTDKWKGANSINGPGRSGDPTDKKAWARKSCQQTF
jgi:hypothetical protein